MGKKSDFTQVVHTARMIVFLVKEKLHLTLDPVMERELQNQIANRVLVAYYQGEIDGLNKARAIYFPEEKPAPA